MSVMLLLSIYPGYKAEIVYGDWLFVSYTV